MNDTLIGWCHHTINFWMGCNYVSKECSGCYAKELMEKKQKEDFNVLRLTQSPWRDAEVLNARAEARNTNELVFTCSMSDFFHRDADPWRQEAWDVIRRCQNLIWLVLTKRPERILDSLPSDWNEGGYPNVWLGTTCGLVSSYNRVDLLREIPCALRFLSCEPLTENISDIDLKGIGWILCGGMSGDLAKKRPMNLRWAASLYEKAQKEEVPFLFKQISHFRTERGINALGLYLAYMRGESVAPESVDCVREFPYVQDFAYDLPGIKGVRFTQPEWQSYCREQGF
jgi:protein gp37